MPNESNPEPKLETETPELKPAKPSKLKRIKSAAVVTGIYVIPTTLFGGMMFLSWKMTKLEFETAKLNFETAKLQDLADTVTQK